MVYAQWHLILILLCLFSWCNFRTTLGFFFIMPSVSLNGWYHLWWGDQGGSSRIVDWLQMELLLLADLNKGTFLGKCWVIFFYFSVKVVVAKCHHCQAHKIDEKVCLASLYCQCIQKSSIWTKSLLVELYLWMNSTYRYLKFIYYTRYSSLNWYVIIVYMKDLCKYL